MWNEYYLPEDNNELGLTYHADNAPFGIWFVDDKWKWEERGPI